MHPRCHESIYTNIPTTCILATKEMLATPRQQLDLPCRIYMVELLTVVLTEKII